MAALDFDTSDLPPEETETNKTLRAAGIRDVHITAGIDAFFKEEERTEKWSPFIDVLWKCLFSNETPKLGLYGGYPSIKFHGFLIKRFAPGFPWGEKAVCIEIYKPKPRSILILRLTIEIKDKGLRVVDDHRGVPSHNSLEGHNMAAFGDPKKDRVYSYYVTDTYAYLIQELFNYMKIELAHNYEEEEKSSKQEVEDYQYKTDTEEAKESLENLSFEEVIEKMSKSLDHIIENR